MSVVAKQAAKFITVGGFATGVHVATALGLHTVFAMPALIANVVAFLVACAVSYLANWRWTFGTVQGHAYAAPRFLIVAIAGFCVNQTVVFILHELLHQPFWLAIIPAVALVPAGTFWLNRTRVFRERI